VMGWFPWKH